MFRATSTGRISVATKMRIELTKSVSRRNGTLLVKMARIHHLSRSFDPCVGEGAIAKRSRLEVLDPLRLASKRVIKERLGERSVLAQVWLQSRVDIASIIHAYRTRSFVEQGIE